MEVAVFDLAPAAVERGRSRRVEHAGQARVEHAARALGGLDLVGPEVAGAQARQEQGGERQGHRETRAQGPNAATD